jgi:hypothetical protein
MGALLIRSSAGVAQHCDEYDTHGDAILFCWIRPCASWTATVQVIQVCKNPLVLPAASSQNLLTRLHRRTL